MSNKSISMATPTLNANIECGDCGVPRQKRQIIDLKLNGFPDNHTELKPMEIGLSSWVMHW